jgi:1-acyl-sn-glycerol-3-phosphate acyltransferase
VIFLIYRIARILFRIYFTIFHRVSITGLAELKKFIEQRGGAPVILAANHESYLDPPLVGMIFPYSLRFIAWDGLFAIPIFSSLLKALGAVPVSQENKSSAAGLLREVIGFIKDGHSVLIFPEGERSPDGSLLPFEGGVALIASRTGSPIIPVWIEGTFEAYPLFRWFPRPKKVSAAFGAPILPEDLQDGLSERERRGMLLNLLEGALVKMRDA